MKRVGIGSRNYTYRRVSYDLPVGGYEFRKVPYIPYRRFFPQRPGLSHRWSFLPFARVDLFHLWNGFLTGSRKWVVGFESQFPRYLGIPRDGAYHYAVEQAGAKGCGAILPMSDYARNLFVTMNQGLLSSEHEEKTTVFHGAVPVHEERSRKGLEEKAAETEALQFCMVGHDFFRKGGVPVLRAFRRIRQTHPQARLIVVSAVEGNDYVTGTDGESVGRAKKELSDSPGGTWHPRLPHAEVLQLLAASHFALLPTLDDTYGWSVLEAMSVGTPVITTDVCALPELVKDGQNGFQIELEKGENRRWIGMGEPAGSQQRSECLEAAYEIIEEALCKLVAGLANPQQQSCQLGEQALAHVRHQHDPESQGRKLADVYDRVLAS